MEKIFREVSSLSPPIVHPQMICVNNAMQAFAQLRYGLRKKLWYFLNFKILSYPLIQRIYILYLVTNNLSKCPGIFK